LFARLPAAAKICRLEDRTEIIQTLMTQHYEPNGLKRSVVGTDCRSFEDEQQLLMVRWGVD
jgi:hypothetical protein